MKRLRIVEDEQVNFQCSTSTKLELPEALPSIETTPKEIGGCHSIKVRALESAYLNQMVVMKIIRKERKGRKAFLA
jgi:hypothetical protein